MTPTSSALVRVLAAVAAVALLSAASPTVSAAGAECQPNGYGYTCDAEAGPVCVEADIRSYSREMTWCGDLHSLKDILGVE